MEYLVKAHESYLSVIFARVSVLVTYIIDAFKRSRQYRETLNELNNLSDRSLQDLGIERLSIPDIARKASYYR